MSENGQRFRNIKALIFDLDGTLIDSKLDLAFSMNATLAHLGRMPLDHETIFSYVGRGVPVLMKRALGEPVFESEIEKGIVFFLDYYCAHMLDNTVPYPGVREALDALRGFEMAVLTNKPVKFSQAIISGLGMNDYFRFVYGGNSFEKKKPDPIGLNTLLRNFEAQPKEAMMVGDSDVDIQTARNAGTWACGVMYGLGSARVPACAPDLLLENLAELPKHLVANVSDR